MTDINIVEQEKYKPELASHYDELLASLHLVESFNHSPEEIQGVCEAMGSSFYLGMLGNVPVAMTTLIHPVLSLGHRTAIVEDVSVHRNYRGMGIGLSMISFVEAEAYGLGANRIELHSSDARIEAHNLYKKTGFIVFDTNLFRKAL